MYKLTIGIPSYQRPAMLEKLVKSIFSCNIDHYLIAHLDIVVIDNDVDRSAEPIIKSLISSNTYEFHHLHYFNYPEKGLSNVRNEIIKKAMLLEADYIACIDDDEYVSVEWLNELIRTVVNNDGDFALGPVIPVFEKKVSTAISTWFFYFKYEDQRILNFIYSSNLIMRTRFLLVQQMEFDPRFNTLGAEDSYFGAIAIKKRATIFWANKAVAYETIPSERASLNWLIKRKFRLANSYMYILLLEKKYIKIVKKIFVSFIYLPIGFFAMILTPINFKYRYYGILKIAESIGALARLFNIKYHEYLKPR